MDKIKDEKTNSASLYNGLDKKILKVAEDSLNR